MAEPTDEEKEMLATSFATGYNHKNKTNYRWENEKSLSPEEPYDFRLFDQGKVLGVQLVRGDVANKDKSYARPARAKKVVDQLQAIFQARGAPSVRIYLNFPKSPKKQQIEKLAQDLEDFIYICCLGELPYLAYEENFDELTLLPLKGHLSDIHIEPHVGKRTGVQISFSWASGELEGELDSVQKVLGAVKLKEGKYDHVILLVDSTGWPIEDEEIPFIRDAVAASPIKEIWVANNFVGNQIAIRVK